MRHGMILMGILALAVVCGAGCGHSTIVFVPQDVINTGGQGDNAQAQLDVDIVCVDNDAVEAIPELKTGALSSRTWFTWRATEQNKIRAAFAADEIYSLRQEAGNKESGHSVYSTRVGDPLVSRRISDRERIAVDIHHPQVFDKHAKILVFGRFHNGTGGLADVQPVMIDPPPSWGKEIVIQVGRQGMSRERD